MNNITNTPCYPQKHVWEEERQQELQCPSVPKHQIKARSRGRFLRVWKTEKLSESKVQRHQTIRFYVSPVRAVKTQTRSDPPSFSSGTSLGSFLKTRLRQVQTNRSAKVTAVKCILHADQGPWVGLTSTNSKARALNSPCNYFIFDYRKSQSNFYPWFKAVFSENL